MPLIMLILLLLLEVTFAYDYFLNFKKSINSYRRDLRKADSLNETFFSSLDSYQVNAAPVTEDKYPWIARVVHSRSLDIPHVCTASCIHQGIFITSARCIYSLKVNYTTVIYQSHYLPARALVVPSTRTKQAFDDIGFIVVEASKVAWKTVELFREFNRTADNFEWLHKLNSSTYKVVGYATEKGIHLIRSPYRRYNLTELDIVIGLDICEDILTFYNRFGGFHVPCYHSCTVEEFKKKDDKCINYHGVEGGAILYETHYLLGVATWGPYFTKYELPVGFSMVNSPNFFSDYACAKLIWTTINKYSTPYTSLNSYQSLCDSGKNAVS